VADLASRVHSCRADSTIGNQIHAWLVTDSSNFVSRLLERHFSKLFGLCARTEISNLVSRFNIVGAIITVSNFIADYFGIRR
jgi:hypothetical protein